MAAQSRRLTARWTHLALSNAPVARSSHCVSAIGGKAYLFGGEAKARHAIDSVVHRLDVQERAWTPLAPQQGAVAPTPRVGHAQCTVRDKLIVFGGRVGVDMGEGNLNDTWAFDVASGEWTPIEASDGTPPCPRSFHRAAAVGDKMYVFGGCGAEGRLADLHEFDFLTRRWSALPRAPSDVTGRGGATFEASTNERALWMCAGFAGYETNDLLQFELDNGAWQREPSSWLRPRSVCASWSFAHPSGPALMLFGGEVSPSDHGHEGAGGFASDLIAVDATSGEPLLLDVEGDSGSVPAARGWAAAAALSPTEGVLVAGLSGDDDAPVRLDDAWLLSVGEPMAYSRMF
eukprot:1598578-Prymnesium_polylepis.2